MNEKQKPTRNKSNGPGNESTKPIPRRPDAERRIRQADRLARVMRVLEMIQSRGRWDLAAMAGELGCSDRTIRRDLDVLELAGVP